MIIIKENLLLVKNDEESEPFSLSKKNSSFNKLMNIYNVAMKMVENKVVSINEEYEKVFNRRIIDHTMSRIKSPESIVAKMKKKNCELNYTELVQNINDIAGVRIICPFKNDVYEVIDLIRRIDDWKIIKEKDYITTPKKSGYMSYHFIVEVPIVIERAKLYAKVEIQIRSMAMDFWAVIEHELQYKNGSCEKIAKDLLAYAKAISKIDDKLEKVSKKQKDAKELKN